MPNEKQNSLHELILNHQRMRFIKASQRFADEPTIASREVELRNSVKSLQFIAEIEDDNFDEEDFEKIPIGDLNHQIDLMVKGESNTSEIIFTSKGKPIS